MELIKLSGSEFKKVAALVYERTGIHLPECKSDLLSNRLRKRLRSLELGTFEEYYKLLKDPSRCEEELPHFLSAVTTNETYFFRNDALWKYFRETWIPSIAAKKKTGDKSLRIWSAASSSGEEAYTAAICLHEKLPQIAAWKISVIGSDISERVLEKAKSGEYNDYAVSRMTPEAIKEWFDVEGPVFRVKAKLKKIVSFQFHNLRDKFPGPKFDLVFLRNVLMYFDVEMKKRVVSNVRDALHPGGLLVVGDVDPLRNTPGLSESLELDYIGPNVYQKPEKAVAKLAVTSGSQS